MPPQPPNDQKKLNEQRKKNAAYNSCVDKARLESYALVGWILWGAGKQKSALGFYLRPGNGLMSAGIYMVGIAAFPSPDEVVDWPARLALGGIGVVTFGIGAAANEIELNRRLQKEDQRLAKEIGDCSKLLQ